VAYRLALGVGIQPVETEDVGIGAHMDVLEANEAVVCDPGEVTGDLDLKRGAMRGKWG
jgi:hypothetical protein